VDVLSGVRFGAQIESAARSHGLDPKFLAAVAAQETGGPGARSGSNIVGDGGHGRGLFQIDDRWHAFAVSPAAMDPAKNADYAAGMLSGLLAKYGGDARAALSAYNAGSPNATGTVTTWGDGARLGYADSVLRHYADLGGNPAALGEELAAGRPETVAGANALAGLAAEVPASPAAAGAAASPYLGGGYAAGGSIMPAAAFQVSLPAPSPYPTQFRPYTSIAGLDSNQPQQIDTQMTSLIDGADGVSSDNSGS
jgi:hypothetical protein